MGNCSSGRDTPSSLFLAHSVAIVSGPSLPMYMVSIIMILDGTVSSGVMPVVSPTVPIAEKHSNITSRSGSAGSRAVTATVTDTVQHKPSEMITNALCMISRGICLPKALASRPVEWEISDFISAKKVVVFIPPPVEPGDAPMNISTHIMSRPAFENPEYGNVAKPAVLAVTLEKNAPSHVIPSDSVSFMSKVPPTRSVAVIVSTIFE